MIQFIHRFEIPQSITTDQGTMFTGEEMHYFTTDYGMQLIKSTPFYAQAIGQAEASNKVFIGILEKMLEENPRDWNISLSETLRAFRNFKRSSIGVIPFYLTYG